MPWTSAGSRALYRTRHSATPERSYHFLVKSARKVGVQMDLHLLRQPLEWRSRQLGSPWPVLIDQDNWVILIGDKQKMVPVENTVFGLLFLHQKSDI